MASETPLRAAALFEKGRDLWRTRKASSLKLKLGARRRLQRLNVGCEMGVNDSINTCPDERGDRSQCRLQCYAAGAAAMEH